MAARLERLDIDAHTYEELTRDFPDREVHQTAGWIEFVAETQGARPVFAAFRDGERTLGYFAGLTFRRFGLTILGSPFPGWTTSYMGFNLLDGIPRRDALWALADFAFGPLGCVHLEVLDRSATAEDADGLGFAHALHDGFELDLTRSEDDLFGRMASACRRCIRKAEREGVTIEEADVDGFADEYYEQLEDVFAKQGLRPTYAVDRVRSLIEHLGPTGNLLLLRARDADGRSIATGIFPGLGRAMYFWGGASWRSSQHLRPNELLIWTAMRTWKARGVRSFDFSGAGDYKRKYGGEPIAIPWFRKSRFPLVMSLRDRAQRLYWRYQDARGRMLVRREAEREEEPVSAR